MCTYIVLLIVPLDVVILCVQRFVVPAFHGLALFVVAVITHTKTPKKVFFVNSYLDFTSHSNSEVLDRFEFLSL